MRRISSSWNSLLTKLGLRRTNGRTPSRRISGNRRLRLESLESREMLAAVTVSNLVDVVNGNVSSIAALIASPGADGISLREAVLAADADVTADTINFQSSLNGGEIKLTKSLGQLNVSTSLTITANSLANGITVNADDPTYGYHNNGDGIRVMNITDPSQGAAVPQVTLVGMTFKGADPGPLSIAPQGGAIRSEALLTLRKMVIRESGADFGGGIYVDVAGTNPIARTVLVIEDSKIESNSSYFDGGGVYVRFSGAGHDTVRIERSSISTNVASDRSINGLGGGLFVTSGNGTQHTVQIIASQVSDNEADAGGGIHLNDTSRRIDLSVLNKSTIAINEAQSGNGGGILFASGQSAQFRLENSTVSGNTAVGTGGGVYANLQQSASLTVDKSTISGNTATGNGGGVLFQGTSAASLRIQESTISGNTSQASGGGVWADVSSSATLLITNAQVTGNTANSDGGGVFARATEGDPQLMVNPQELKISQSTISGNTAYNRGGGLYTKSFRGTQTLVEETRVTGNHVPYSSLGSKRNGGGIYAYVWDDSQGEDKPRYTITRSTVDNNDTYSKGGGIFVCAKYYGDFIATNSTFSGNQTTDLSAGHGGGVFIARYEFNNSESVDAYLHNVTITQNISAIAGGLESANLLNVRTRVANSIISQNFNRQPTPQASNFVGKFIQSEVKNNLIGSNSAIVIDPNTGLPYERILNENGVDFVPDATNVMSNSPGLSPLQDFGGPTPTHALQLGSPAIDRGSNALALNPLTNASFATDQRGTGFVRSHDFTTITYANAGPVDIGAYELGGTARVANVTIKSSISTVNQSLHPAISFNGRDDVTDRDGTGRQLQTIPIARINTIQIAFTQPMQSVPQNTLSLYGLHLNPTIPGVALHSFTVGMNTATWEYANELVSDQYLLRLSDAGNVTDQFGAALDGEWTNPARLFQTANDPFSGYYQNAAISKFPSGNGTAGGAFQFVVTVLAGDASLDNRIDVTDVGILSTNYETGPGHTFLLADFSGDGLTNITDVGYLATNISKHFLHILNVADLDPVGGTRDGIVNNSDLTTYNLNPSLYDIDRNGIAGEQADLDMLNRQITAQVRLDWA